MTTELSRPKGHGLTRVAHNLRHNVGPHDWAGMVGTDYWLFAGSGDLTTASGATNLAGLDSYGWTTTSIVYTNAVTGDFFSSSDQTPPNFSANASGDVLSSPAIFGGHAHARAAGQHLGYMPTRLICEFYGAFITASADESATNMGLHNGSALVASIYSDATVFRLSNGSTTDAGATVDNSYHQWKIVMDSTTSLMEWFIDGTSQGTLAITQDVYPVAFVTTASTTNRWALVWAHIYYD